LVIPKKLSNAKTAKMTQKPLKKTVKNSSF
jgi:hypothetical protein